MKKIFLLSAILAVSLYFNTKAIDSLCLGDGGTRAFMTGEYGIAYQMCKVYDYSRFFPGFEEKSDSFRLFRKF